MAAHADAKRCSRDFLHFSNHRDPRGKPSAQRRFPRSCALGEIKGTRRNGDLGSRSSASLIDIPSVRERCDAWMSINSTPR